MSRRSGRRRFRCRPRPKGRNRMSDGGFPYGLAGPSHEPSPKEDHWSHLKIFRYRHIHQSDPDEDRHHVLKS